jgi:hypothetical protein
MICEECGEYSKNHIKIGDTALCKECIIKYNIKKCPTDFCTNVISLNGYGTYSIENNICKNCTNMICDTCIIKYNSDFLCYDCFSDDIDPNFDYSDNGNESDTGYE